MKFRQLVSVVLSALLIVTATPVQAGMVGTQSLLTQDARAMQVADVQGFLARDDVRKQMQSLGVDPVAAGQRVAAMTDGELQKVSQQINSMPAGGDAVSLLVLVILILLLLELLGVTHIFN